MFLHILQMKIQLTFARTHPPLSKISVERLFLKVPTFSLCSITWQNSAGTVSALAKIAVERHGFLVPWRILLRVERFFISEFQGFNCISAPLLLWPSYIPLLSDTEFQLFNLKKKNWDCLVSNPFTDLTSFERVLLLFPILPYNITIYTLTLTIHQRGEEGIFD